MMKIKEVIVVEGRYDKNTLSQLVDATIIETSGFGIFNNKQKLALLRKLAETRGLIILTDSDSAGFMIRSHIKGAIDPKYVKQAYIPDIYGKERRKSKASKEGKLGVEGMKRAIIEEALIKAGATIDGVESGDKKPTITKADMMRLGLAGVSGSAEKRNSLMKYLDLPEKMSANALLDVLNALYDREEFIQLVEKLC